MNNITAQVSIYDRIKKAIRENLIPGLILQAFALSIVLLYFYYQPAASIFSFVSDLKLEYSALFAIVATSIFGGFLPTILLYYKKRIPGPFLLHMCFNLVLWAFMGWLIDSFYQLQAVIFGNGNDIATIVKKTLLDQFVFSVFVTSPFVTAMYIWRECNFRWFNTRTELKERYFTEKLPATIFSTWIVWLPAVTLVYAMPPELQLPLFNLVLFFFVLLISALNRD